MSSYKEDLHNITTFVFDYDGVLTDGTVIIDKEGTLLRTANVKDGYALGYAAGKGYRIVIITGGRTESVRDRFKALNITDIFLGVKDKKRVLLDYLSDNDIKPSNVLYMGDDIPDYQAMMVAGISACPADAAPEIKAIASYISDYHGGRGCARDVIEQVLKVQGKWFDVA